MCGSDAATSPYRQQQEAVMPLDAKKLAGDIVTEVGAAQKATGSATAAAAPAAGAGDFCGIWVKAKPILELLGGLAILIPGVGVTAGGVLRGLIKIGDQLSSELCG
jgi:hypothetical protein